MAHQVLIPAAGESITSANVAEWHVRDGDLVQAGQTLVTLETDKVSNELEAEVAGKITILVEEGELEIGTKIAEIDEAASPEQSPSKKPDGDSDPEEESKASPAPAAPAEKPVEIIVPAAGESITSANIGQWHVASGETIQKGETLVTLETDKVSNELEAECTGLLEILVPEGEEVEIGTVIGQLTPTAQESSQPSPKPTEPVKEASPASQASPSKPSPAQASAAAPAKKPVSSPEGRTSRQKMSMLRRKISQHLVNAQQTAAILTTFNEVDMSAIMQLRKSVQEDFVAKHEVKLGFMSFFVKAVVHALKEVPQINGRIDGSDIIQNHYYDMGVAIGTEKGLVVPVLRGPDQMGFADIEKEIRHYALKAKEGKIELSDLQGGVFTISNGGTYGSLLSTPILNPPQSGILGMHTIQQRPVAVDGKVEIRPMMYLALSYDHRLVDGKEAVTFLIHIKNSLENPTRLLLEM